MTAADDDPREFDAAQVAVLSDAARVETLEAVLGTGPVPRREKDQALAALRERGLVDDEGIDPTLADELRTLVDPALEVRLRCPRADLRAVLAVDSRRQVLAVRTGGRVSVSDAWAGSPRDAARVLGAVLDHVVGSTAAADVPVGRFPLRPLSDRLDGCRDAHDVAAAFAGEGLPAADAAVLADAVSSACHHTEIVARVRAGGLPITSVGAVAVLDGPAGRVIAGPDLSVDGTPWTTFSPGTAVRLEQALGRLVAAQVGECDPWGSVRGDVA